MLTQSKIIVLSSFHFPREFLLPLAKKEIELTYLGKCLTTTLQTIFIIDLNRLSGSPIEGYPTARLKMLDGAV